MPSLFMCVIRYISLIGSDTPWISDGKPNDLLSMEQYHFPHLIGLVFFMNMNPSCTNIKCQNLYEQEIENIFLVNRLAFKM